MTHDKPWPMRVHMLPATGKIRQIHIILISNFAEDILESGMSIRVIGIVVSACGTHTLFLPELISRTQNYHNFYYIT
jgi:hypothetical protein